MEGNCVMTLTLHQQGHTTYKDLCNFEFWEEFEKLFSYYKEKNTDVSTAKGNEVVIPGGIKMHICLIFLLCIYRRGNKANNPNLNNLKKWTFDDFFILFLVVTINLFPIRVNCTNHHSRRYCSSNKEYNHITWARCLTHKNSRNFFLGGYVTF